MTYVVRDILDQQLLDRTGQRIGRVDGIVLEVRTGQPPRVVCIELGATTLARRIHPRLALWLAALQRRVVNRDVPATRIPWSKVRDVGHDVEVDVSAAELPALDAERWLRRRVIARIPGGG